MARTPSCDKSGMRKGTWTAEEDRKLIAYVTRYGCWNWRQLPKFAGLKRCGKSCRLRWMNYLRPNIKRGNFTQQEEEIIVRLHKKLGNRWSIIAAELPGRTDNEVKNHWHTSLKKKFQENTKVTNEENTKSKDIGSTQKSDISIFHVTPPSSSQISDITCQLSPLSSSSEFSSTNSDTSLDDFGFLDSFIDSMDEKFWTELDDPNVNKSSGLLVQNMISNCGNFINQDTNSSTTTNDAFLVSPNHSYSNESFVMDNEFGSFLNGYIESTIVDSFWTQPCVADMSHVTTEPLLLAPLAMESEYFCTLYDEDLWS